MIGAILIVIGLYSVLWGKHKEQMESKVADEIPLAVKDGQSCVISGLNMIDVKNDFTEEDSKNKKPSSVVINMTVAEPPSRDNQEGKA